MGFGEWLRGERQSHESGETTSEQYANNLEKKAREVPDKGNAEFLKSRARFIRDDAENKARAKREAEQEGPKGLW